MHLTYLAKKSASLQLRRASLCRDHPGTGWTCSSRLLPSTVGAPECTASAREDHSVWFLLRRRCPYTTVKFEKQTVLHTRALTPGQASGVRYLVCAVKGEARLLLSQAKHKRLK